MKKNIYGILLAIISTISLSASDSMKDGLFFGMGGSYNSVTINQKVSGTGISDVYTNGVLVATGEAGGPANPFNETRSTFAPVIRLGYSHRMFEDDNWSLAATASYKYLGVTLDDSPIDSFQIGQYTSTNESENSFTGNFIIGSYQNTVVSQLSLLISAGYACADNYNIYLGASPVVFSVQSNVYQAIGFADENGVHSDVTGTPDTFLNSHWVWGGAAEVGINYNLSDRWVLNCSYNFAITGTAAVNNFATFTSVSNGNTNIGSFSMEGLQRYIVQAVAVSVNFIF